MKKVQLSYKRKFNNRFGDQLNLTRIVKYLVEDQVRELKFQSTTRDLRVFYLIKRKMHYLEL